MPIPRQRESPRVQRRKKECLSKSRGEKQPNEPGSNERTLDRRGKKKKKRRVYSEREGERTRVESFSKVTGAIDLPGCAGA